MKAKDLNIGAIFITIHDELNNKEFYRRCYKQRKTSTVYTWKDFPENPKEGYGSNHMSNDVDVIIIEKEN